jgi:hypothetical protein
MKPNQARRRPAPITILRGPNWRTPKRFCDDHGCYTARLWQEIVEVKSTLILQPGPAALTDGVASPCWDIGNHRAERRPDQLRAVWGWPPCDFVRHL